MLFMEGCQIGNAEARIVSNALDVNSTLKGLWLGGERSQLYISKAFDEIAVSFIAICTEKDTEDKAKEEIRRVCRYKKGFSLCLDGKNWESPSN